MGRDLRNFLRYCQGAALLAAAVFLIMAACLPQGEGGWQDDVIAGAAAGDGKQGKSKVAAEAAEAGEEAGQAVPAEAAEAAEKADQAVPAEAAEAAEKADQAAPAEAAEAVEETNQAAPAEAAEAVEETDQAVAAEAAEAGEEANQAGTPETVEAVRETENSGQDETEPRQVALTFDDGPHPVYTKLLLDGLKERQIRATFFVIGENIPGNEELISRMAKEGHIIGNHTYSHVKISDMDAESACAEVEKTSELIRATTGENTEFVRPPFGEWNKNLETEFVMIPVLWDVDPLDWTTKNTDLVVQRVLDGVENGDIILLHDCYESSVQAALRIADALTADGWKFVTVDELILE